MGRRRTDGLRRPAGPRRRSRSACASSGAVPRPFPGAPVVRRTPPARLRRAKSRRLPRPSRLPRPESRPRPSSPPPRACAARRIATGAAVRRASTAADSRSTCSRTTASRFPATREAQFEVGDAITDEAIEAGDLLFFSTTDSGPSHVAIAISLDEFVHAPSSRGVVRVERRSLRGTGPNDSLARGAFRPRGTDPCGRAGARSRA